MNVRLYPFWLPAKATSNLTGCAPHPMPWAPSPSSSPLKTATDINLDFRPTVLGFHAWPRPRSFIVTRGKDLRKSGPLSGSHELKHSGQSLIEVLIWIPVFMTLFVGLSKAFRKEREQLEALYPTFAITNPRGPSWFED